MTSGRDDLTYYRKRADEERVRATTASRSDVRRIHAELAVLYENRLNGGKTARPRLGIAT